MLLSRHVKGVPFFNGRYTKGVPFLSKSGIQKGKGLDLGAEPANTKLCSVPLPPPPEAQIQGLYMTLNSQFPLLNFCLSDWFTALRLSASNKPAFCFVRKLDFMLSTAAFKSFRREAKLFYKIQQRIPKLRT